MRKSILSVCVLVGLMAMTVQAKVIDTYEGTNGSYWNLSSNGGVAVQWFTVDAGQTGTKFEFFCEKGAASNPGYHCIVQIYDSSKNYVAGDALTADQFGGSSAWVSVDNLSLASGTYFAQMYTNDGGFAGYLHAVLINPSTYAGGYAAAGWGGGTATGLNQDFMARLTTVPEPVTILVLMSGALGLLRRRIA
jgi:hypothetical protein